MRADKFAVVVQWGGGYIYFQGFHLSEIAAQLAANAHYIQLSKRRIKRGAQPTVMVWEKKSTGLQLVQGEQDA